MNCIYFLVKIKCYDEFVIDLSVYFYQFLPWGYPDCPCRWGREHGTGPASFPHPHLHAAAPIFIPEYALHFMTQPSKGAKGGYTLSFGLVFYIHRVPTDFIMTCSNHCQIREENKKPENLSWKCKSSRKWDQEVANSPSGIVFTQVALCPGEYFAGFIQNLHAIWHQWIFAWTPAPPGRS